jgi:CRISPR-associated protein Cas2
MPAPEVNILVVYDVGEKRVAKVHALLSKYLYWQQRSVFAGTMDKRGTSILAFHLKPILDLHHDSVFLFSLVYPQDVRIEQWGRPSPIRDAGVIR